MTTTTVRKSDLNLTLRTYANHGASIYQVTKLVDGYSEPFTELTTADFRGKVGQRVESCGWTGPGYKVLACTPVVVL